jgi:hypothetical protein
MGGFDHSSLSLSTALYIASVNISTDNRREMARGGNWRGRAGDGKMPLASHADGERRSDIADRRAAANAIGWLSVAFPIH